MSMPGFAAESSWYRSQHTYRGVATTPAGVRSIIPAARNINDILGDIWREQCQQEGGSMVACCNRKERECRDGCPGCTSQCYQRWRRCRGLAEHSAIGIIGIGQPPLLLTT